MDGAEFPYIIKVEYTVDEKAYTKRKWINAGNPVPMIGSNVQVTGNTVLYHKIDAPRYAPSKFSSKANSASLISKIL